MNILQAISFVADVLGIARFLVPVFRWFPARWEPAYWIEKIGESDQLKREKAINILVKIGERSVQSCIKALSDNENGYRRESAATVLGGIGKDSLLPLIKEYENPSLIDKELIRMAFRNMCPEDMREELGALLSDNHNWYIRHGAIVCIGEIMSYSSYPDIGKILDVALSDSQWQVRYEAVRVLRDWKDARSKDHICNILKKEEHSEVKAIAAEALGEIGDNSSDVINALIGSLNDPYSRVREKASSVLGELKSPNAVNPLLGLIKSERHFEVRKAIITALCKICDPGAITFLREICLSVNPDERLSAIKSLEFKKTNLDKVKDILEEVITKETQNHIKQEALKIRGGLV